MAKAIKPAVEPSEGRPPAKTPEARENQLVMLAYNLAEKQLRDGTASSQIITQLLKSGTEKDRLERVRIEMEIRKGESIIEANGNDKDQNVLYQAAIDAMRSYQGLEPGSDDPEY